MLENSTGIGTVQPSELLDALLSIKCKFQNKTLHLCFADLFYFSTAICDMCIHSRGVLCRNGRVQKSLERSMPSSESSHCWDASGKAWRETFVFSVDFILNAEETKNQE